MDYALDAPLFVAIRNCFIVFFRKRVDREEGKRLDGKRGHGFSFDGLLRSELFGQWSSVGVGLCQLVVVVSIPSKWKVEGFYGFSRGFEFGFITPAYNGDWTGAVGFGVL